MLKWLRQLGAKKASASDTSRGRAVFVRGKYDSAQTTLENRRHWINADHLSANSAISADVRRTLRSRTRYEVANNSYAKGIVLTLANYVVGTGPRLQMLTDDPAVNRVIEKEFTRWAKAIGLAHKLRTMRIGQCESGECFGLLTSNPQMIEVAVVGLPEAIYCSLCSVPIIGRALTLLRYIGTKLCLILLEFIRVFSWPVALSP